MTLPSIPPRLVATYRLDEKIYCPHGHKIEEDAAGIPHGWVRCTKRVRSAVGRTELCGELLYVCDHHNGTVSVARIDWREAYHMRKLQMTPPQVAEFLQLPWAQEAP